MNLETFIERDWKPVAFSTYRSSTCRRVGACIRTQVIPNFGHVPLAEITRSNVDEWFARYSRTAPGGANRTLDVLRAVLNHAERLGLIPRNPAVCIERNRMPSRIRFLSTFEVRQLLDAIEAVERNSRGLSGVQQANIFRLLLFTGCRKGEIVRLRWRDWDERSKRLLIRDGKTGSRFIPLSGQGQAVLSRVPHDDPEWVFPGPDGGHRTVELSAWKAVRRRNAGLSDVRLHDLRHTFASHAVMSGVPLPVVQQLLGHKTPRMTMRYAHLSDRSMIAAAERVGTFLSTAMSRPVEEEEDTG